MDRSQRKVRAATVGRIVRAVRKFRGDRQDHVAERAGLKREEVSNVERGAHRLRSKEMRASIAAGMRVPVAFIDALVLSDEPIPVAMTAAAFDVPAEVVLAAIRESAPAQEAAP